MIQAGSQGLKLAMAGDHLDLNSDVPDKRPTEDGQRPFLGVHFNCCQIYGRIYRNSDSTAYAGHCPRCSRPVRVRIGPGGSDNRFYTAY